MTDDFFAPDVPLHILERVELFFREVQAFPIHVFVVWLPAERSLFCQSVAFSVRANDVE